MRSPRGTSPPSRARRLSKEGLRHGDVEAWGGATPLAFPTPPGGVPACAARAGPLSHALPLVGPSPPPRLERPQAASSASAAGTFVPPPLSRELSPAEGAALAAAQAAAAHATRVYAALRSGDYKAVEDAQRGAEATAKALLGHTSEAVGAPPLRDAAPPPKAPEGDRHDDRHDNRHDDRHDDRHAGESRWPQAGVEVETIEQAMKEQEGYGVSYIEERVSRARAARGLPPSSAPLPAAVGPTTGGPAATAFAAPLAAERESLDADVNLIVNELLEGTVDVEKAFRLIDANNDGELSRAEVIKACRADERVRTLLGLPRVIRQEDGTRDAFEEVFQRIDADDSKAISLDEFCRVFSVRSPRWTSLAPHS